MDVQRIYQWGNIILLSSSFTRVWQMPCCSWITCHWPKMVNCRTRGDNSVQTDVTTGELNQGLWYRVQHKSTHTHYHYPGTTTLFWMTSSKTQEGSSVLAKITTESFKLSSQVPNLCRNGEGESSRKRRCDIVNSVQTEVVTEMLYAPYVPLIGNRVLTNIREWTYVIFSLSGAQRFVIWYAERSA